MLENVPRNFEASFEQEGSFEFIALVRNNDIETMQRKLLAGESSNQERFGQTAIETAVVKGYVKMVQLLLAAGANSRVGKMGSLLETALYYHAESVKACESFSEIKDLLF